LEEALAPDETIFGSERVIEIVRSHRDHTARQIVEALYQGVREFSRNNEQIDDVTTIVVKVAKTSDAK
jgi:sigma-B regulation protein RsbU (phosphoserine phosphatase)